jgi:hypothetical protein
MGSLSNPRPREEVVKKFKVGDKVRLISGYRMRARIGATGVVKGYEESAIQHGMYYVYVNWDRNDLVGDQKNGGYNPDEFEVIVTTSLSAVLDNVACPRCKGKMYEKMSDVYGPIKKCIDCGYC